MTKTSPSTALLAARSRIQKLRKALKNVRSILEPGACKANRCLGCGAEMDLALQEAGKALENDRKS